MNWRKKREGVIMINDCVLLTGGHRHDHDNSVGPGSSYQRDSISHAGIVPVLLFPDAIRSDHGYIHPGDYSQP